MRSLFQVVFVGLVVITCALGNEKKLVIDVYSVKASGVVQEKGFALWAKDLREGRASLTQYPNILHEEHPLGEAFDIANEAQPEDDSPKFVVAAHVALRVEKDAYKITFSELGRPPAYSGQTSLTIRPQDRRVLMLPAIDSGQGYLLETVVLIQYKGNPTDGDDGEKSRFEI
jgi:hypothetical protein